MVLGEGPGKRDIDACLPFTSKSEAGSELNELYLRLAGLRRSDVWVSNLALCGFPATGLVDRKNPWRPPTKEEASDCAKCHLGAELTVCQPEVVVAVGAVACSIWRDSDNNLAPISVAKLHGIPQWKRYGAWEGWVFPVYHPNAGLRESLFMRMMVLDWTWLGQLLTKQFKVHAELPTHGYTRITKPSQLTAYLQQHKEAIQAFGAGIDTEQDEDTRGLPYCVTVSADTRTGILIKAADLAALEALWQWMRETDPLMVFHNKVHDGPVVHRMGGPKPYSYRWEDTIVKASALQLPSLGLKSLAGRYLGMHMLDYDETVTPPSLAALVRWAECVELVYASDHMTPHVFKTGARKGHTEMRVTKDTGKVLKSGVGLVRNMAKAGNTLLAMGRAIGMLEAEAEEVTWKSAGDVDGEDLAPPMTKVVNRVKGWDPEKLAAVETMVGMRAPRRSIIHVEEPTLLQYACGDSLATIRLKPILDRLMHGFSSQVKRGVYE